MQILLRHKKADFVKVGFMVKIVYNLVTPYRGVDQLWVLSITPVSFDKI